MTSHLWVQIAKVTESIFCFHSCQRVKCDRSREWEETLAASDVDKKVTGETSIYSILAVVACDCVN